MKGHAISGSTVRAEPVEQTERVTCPQLRGGCGREVAIRSAAAGMAGRTVPHNRLDGTRCRQGFFAWFSRTEYGPGTWFLEYWYDRRTGQTWDGGGDIR